MWLLRFFGSVFIYFGNYVMMWISGRWDCQGHHLGNHTGVLLIWIIYFLVRSGLPLEIWRVYKFGTIFFFQYVLNLCIFFSGWNNVHLFLSRYLLREVWMYSCYCLIALFSFIGEFLRESFVLTDSNFSPPKLFKASLNQICSKLLLSR